MEDISPSLDNEIENEQLKELVEKLKQENNHIKLQFEEAVSISDQVESIHSQNTKLTTEIRQVKNEREDLKRRLLISTRSFEELTQKYENLKKDFNIHITNNQESQMKEVQKIKIECDSVITSLKNELEKTQKECEEKNIFIQMAKSKMDRALANGERYFHAKINDFDNLIELLNRPSFLNDPNLSPIINNDVNIKESKTPDKKYIKKYKAKLRILRTKKDEEIENLKEMIQNLKGENNKLNIENKDLVKQIQDLKDDNNLFENKTKLTIKNLENRIETLKKSNSIQQETESMVKPFSIDSNSEFEFELAPVPKIEIKPTHKIDTKNNKEEKGKEKKIEEIKEQFLEKIEDLNRQLKLCQEQKDKIYAEAKQHESEKQKFELDYERLRGELNSLKIIHSECQNEISTLRETLSRLSIGQKSISPKKIDNQNQQQSLLKVIDSQKLEIDRLNKIKDEEKNQKLELLKKNNQMEETINDLNEQLQKVQERYDDFCLEFERHPKQTSNDLLPPSTFSCPELDKQVACNIEKIASNPSLQPASKIRNSFKIIMSFYENQIDGFKDVIQTLNSESDAMKKIFNKFLIDISLSLSDETITIDDLMQPQPQVSNLSPFIKEPVKTKTPEFFISRINAIKSNNQDLEKRCLYYESLINQLYQIFGINGNESDPIAQVEIFNNQFKEQIKNMNNLKKQIKALKKGFSSLKKSKKNSEDQINQLNIYIEEYKKNISEKEGEIEKLKKTIKKLKFDIVNLNQDLDSAKTLHEDSKTELQKMNNDAFAAMSNKMKENEERLKEELSNTISQLNEITMEMKETDSQYEKCKELLVKEKKINQELKNKIENLQEEIKNKDTNCMVLLKDEKQQLNESFERTFDQLRRQCEMCRLDVQKLTQSLADSEELNKRLKIQCAQLSAEKNKIIEELHSFEAANIRQQKIFESTLKTKVLSLDADYNKKYEEIKSQNELNLRKIFSYVADSFRTYFNPCIQIDEKSFRLVIENVKQELKRLSDTERTIRGMLGTSESQTTEDAVAQLLLDHPLHY